MSKVQKFRVDFFVLCNNSPGKYFIIHCDIYQGKNAANIGIPHEIRNLPATQKAVVNSIIQSNLMERNQMESDAFSWITGMHVQACLLC
jgi:hypothetical protein